MERNGESAEQTEQPADELKDTENVIEQRRNDECVVGDDADADNEGNNLLPVEVCKDELMDLIRKHSVLVCVGETGSGKTTKIPQLILEAGISGDRMIGVTQPRRVAAITVANRVAEERGCELGREVGYMVRFDDCSSPATKIKYMTDGCLVRECLSDPLLKAYSIIMLDEAHERSIHTDVLFGLMKQCLRERDDVKVIVTSATLDFEKISSYYGNCPVMFVPGRVFSVDIYHSKTHQVMTATGPATDSYVEACVETAMKIHSDQAPGHILVFLTGQDEIERACHKLVNMKRQYMEEFPNGFLSFKELQVLPLYSSLPVAAQKRVFAKVNPDVRKCVIATNIAETSITVPDVRYVVDSGFVKQKVYNPQTHMEHLVVVPISQVAAVQRSGRAGRTAPGQSYRMYSKESFQRMVRETVPEIKRSNLANTTLYLKVLGVHDVVGFDFLEPPSQDQLFMALRMLHTLGALDDDGKPTPLGLQMSRFPLEPNISRMLIAANDNGCTDEVLTIAAMLSAENIWLTRRVGRGQIDDEAIAQHIKLMQPDGDHTTYLHVYQTWEAADFRDSWLDDNFISKSAMHLARRVRRQLEGEASKAGLSPQRTVSGLSASKAFRRISRSVAAGFFMNAAKRTSKGNVYTSVPTLGFTDKVSLMHLHPQSALLHTNHPAECVVYQELVFTAKAFMRHVLRVNTDYLNDYRSQVVNVSTYRLSGQPDPEPEPGAEEDTASHKRNLDPQSEDTSAANTIPQAALESARARFLARKRQRVGNVK